MHLFLPIFHPLYKLTSLGGVLGFPPVHVPSSSLPSSLRWRWVTGRYERIVTRLGLLMPEAGGGASLCPPSAIKAKSSPGTHERREFCVGGPRYFEKTGRTGAVQRLLCLNWGRRKDVSAFETWDGPVSWSILTTCRAKKTLYYQKTLNSSPRNGVIPIRYGGVARTLTA